LIRKELSELAASRALWLLLLMIGLLTGQAFIAAVNAYAEASGIGGGPAALAQGLSPLDGVLTPALGGYDLAITLLFPFVAIRLIAAEKSSDALKLMLQLPASLGRQIGAKVVALLAVWIISLVPFSIALILWRSYGGHLHAAEALILLAGYTLRFLLTASIAMAAASLMSGAANAAIVVLGFTIGTWALDFIAAGRGGIVQTLASFTPSATLRTFERGLFRADVVLVMLIVSLLGFAITATWLHLGQSIRARIARAAVIAAIAFIAIIAAAQVRASFDVSENRRNSFGIADARSLAGITTPLSITIFLSSEDPRMSDFESNVLLKLRRSMHDVRVAYPIAGRSGLFENDSRYGEILYRLGAKTVMSRSTTEEIVLDTIYELAGVRVPVREVSSYPGYPLARRAKWAAVVFYGVWPAIVITVILSRRRTRSAGGRSKDPPRTSRKGGGADDAKV
jgi:ABC-type transport system involved in multi-copper enzyme maturation permease subunit